MRYIELSNNKRPKSKLEDYISLNEAKKCEAYGRILEYDEIVVDIDSQKEADKLLEVIKGEGLQTIVYRTSRGYHFLFKNRNNIKNVTHSPVPLGITVDIKAGRNNSYQVLKLNGKEREIVYSIEPIQEIPKWLLPYNHKAEFLDMREGDGRNDALFRSIIPMTKIGMTQKEIEETLEIINKYMFAESLVKNEITAMISDNSIIEARTQSFFEGKTLQTNVIADYIKTNKQCRYYNGNIYYYTDLGYKCDYKGLQSIMYDLVPVIKTNHIKEVINKLDVDLYSTASNIDLHYIQCKNGLVNLYTGEFKQFTPDIFTPITIPVYFNDKADTTEIETSLKLYADNDEGIYELLLEFIAYLFFSTNKFRKMFILYGIGSNGKSKYTAIIERFIGKENTTSLSIKDLDERFKVAALATSKCNIGNDISGKMMHDSDMIKKLTGEDTINADRKNREPIEFECSTKFIFSCNKLPGSSDVSYGFYNRFKIIPFKFDFDTYKTDKVFSLDEMCNVNNMSALLNLIIPRYKRLVDNNCFSKSKSVDESLVSYMCANDDVFKWYFDNAIYNQQFDNVTDAYNEYLLYCGMKRIKNPKPSLQFMENLNNVSKIYNNIIK